MSSSDYFGSLSGLAVAAIGVERDLGVKPMDRETFRRLQEQINALQTACPNHEGVLQARVRWYELALENFDLYAVDLIRRGEGYNLTGLWSATGLYFEGPLFVTPDTLEHFLRRGYLKGEFPRLYKRAHNLYGQVLRTAMASQTIHAFFSERRERMERNLLEGKL